MEIKNLETNRLIIKSTKKEDADFCLDIWLDEEMGKTRLVKKQVIPF